MQTAKDAGVLHSIREISSIGIFFLLWQRTPESIQRLRLWAAKVPVVILNVEAFELHAEEDRRMGGHLLDSTHCPISLDWERAGATRLCHKPTAYS